MKAREIIEEKVCEDLKLQRNESLVKMASEIKRERFDVFFGGIMATASAVIDANQYEDFTRNILGSKAYLLFSFDKLMIQVSLKSFNSIYRQPNNYWFFQTKTQLQRVSACTKLIKPALNNSQRQSLQLESQSTLRNSLKLCSKTHQF